MGLVSQTVPAAASYHSLDYYNWLCTALRTLDLLLYLQHMRQTIVLDDITFLFVTIKLINTYKSPEVGNNWSCVNLCLSQPEYVASQRINCKIHTNHIHK